MSHWSIATPKRGLRSMCHFREERFWPKAKVANFRIKNSIRNHLLHLKRFLERLLQKIHFVFDKGHPFMDRSYCIILENTTSLFNIITSKKLYSVHVTNLEKLEQCYALAFSNSSLDAGHRSMLGFNKIFEMMFCIVRMSHAVFLHRYRSYGESWSTQKRVQNCELQCGCVLHLYIEKRC